VGLSLVLATREPFIVQLPRGPACEVSMPELMSHAGLPAGALRGAAIYAEQQTTLHTNGPSWQRINVYTRKPSSMFFEDRDRLFVGTTRQRGGVVWLWPLKSVEP
jgi:hypothetical protein